MIILQIRNLWFKKKWEKNVSSVLQSAVFRAKIQIFSRSKLAHFDLQQAGRRDKIVKSSKIRDVQEGDRNFQRIPSNILPDLIPV